MKPFNLEKFLNGEPAITRDGRKVIDWKYFKNAENGYKLAVIIDKKKHHFFIQIEAIITSLLLVVIMTFLWKKKK